MIINLNNTLLKCNLDLINGVEGACIKIEPCMNTFVDWCNIKRIPYSFYYTVNAKTADEWKSECKQLLKECKKFPAAQTLYLEIVSEETVMLWDTILEDIPSFNDIIPTGIYTTSAILRDKNVPEDTPIWVQWWGGVRETVVDTHLYASLWEGYTVAVRGYTVACSQSIEPSDNIRMRRFHFIKLYPDAFSEDNLKVAYPLWRFDDTIINNRIKVVSASKYLGAKTDKNVQGWVSINDFKRYEAAKN